MQRFKQRWEITQNWQLLYPFLGFVGLAYSSYKLSTISSKFDNIFLIVTLTCVITFVLLYVTLKLFKFLEKRWKVSHRWKVIRIFLIFALTGSMSVIVTNPIFEFVGFTKSLFNSIPAGSVIYYILKFILILPFYKVLLVFFGWIFGEYNFFLNFALRLAKRLGFKGIIQRFESK